MGLAVKKRHFMVSTANCGEKNVGAYVPHPTSSRANKPAGSDGGGNSTACHVRPASTVFCKYGAPGWTPWQSPVTHPVCAYAKMIAVLPQLCRSVSMNGSTIRFQG